MAISASWAVGVAGAVPPLGRKRCLSELLIYVASEETSFDAGAQP